MVSLKTGKAEQADLCRKNLNEADRENVTHPDFSVTCTHKINGDNQVQLQSRLHYWRVHM